MYITSLVIPFVLLNSLTIPNVSCMMGNFCVEGVRWWSPLFYMVNMSKKENKKSLSVCDF